jgi:hypothetical protein
MTTARAIKQSTSVDPVEVFRARCAARATLLAAGEIKCVPDAVDPLQELAKQLGLIKLIGQDAVQAIMAEAFLPVRDWS